MPLAENRWTKKRKAEEEAAIVPAANVVVQFQSDAGETAGEYTWSLYALNTPGLVLLACA